MGKVTVRRADGTALVVRTTVKTKHIRLAHENPVGIDLRDLGATPALGDLFLSTTTALVDLDVTALTGHPSLASLTARVADVFALAPLATTPIRSLTLTVEGAHTPDFSPLAGHKTLSDVSLTCAGTQAALDLSFVRTLPKLQSLDISGGDWKTLDLEPLRELPLRSLTLSQQYIAEVDLKVIAQPALEHLMLQDLEIRKDYWDLFPLRHCPNLQFLSLLGGELGTLELTGIAGLARLRRFDPPNVKSMLVDEGTELLAPGLAPWRGNIGSA
jgi:hypothetical protein